MDRLLNTLLEPCPALVEYLLPKVGSDPNLPVEEIISRARVGLLNLIEQYPESIDFNAINEEKRALICAIVGAHPRLGVPKASIGQLSKHSQMEQKSLENGDPRLAEKLNNLNNEYETKFPGLKFVVWVNGRSREVIMDIMKDRINRGLWILEVKDSFNAMCDIALDRFQKSILTNTKL